MSTPIAQRGQNAVKIPRMSIRNRLLESISESGMSDRQVSVLATGSTDTVRNMRRGASPRTDTLEALCKSLGLELHVGPPRSSSSGSKDLYVEGRDTEAGLSPAHLRDLESSARGLVRVVVEAGGDPSWVERHAWEEEVRVEAGRVAVEVGGKRRALGPGGSVRIPAGELHSHYSLEPSRWVLLAEGAGESLDDPTALAEPRVEYDPGIRQIGVVAALDAEDIPPGARPVDVRGIPATESTDDEEFELVRRYDGREVRMAAGHGEIVDTEPEPGEVKFRRNWLRSHGLKATNLMLLDVVGDSMFPTIREGDAVLIDESRRSPQSGRVYALRTTEGLLVKRLRRRRGRWWADSDNDEYPARPIHENDEALGLVVWWAHTEQSR